MKGLERRLRKIESQVRISDLDVFQERATEFFIKYGPIPVSDFCFALYTVANDIDVSTIPSDVAKILQIPELREDLEKLHEISRNINLDREK